MLSTDQEYEYFISQENFQLAWRRLNSSTILDTKDRLGLKIFSAKTEEHLNILINKLTSPTNYCPYQPFFMYGPKKDGSVRVRTFLEVRDRIVYQAIGNVIIENCLEDIWASANKIIFAHIPTKKHPNGKLSDFTFLRTFANSTNKGQYERFLDAVHGDIKKAAEKSDIWVIETDIASFYPSLDHQLICEMLLRRGWLKDKQLLQLLTRCLKSWSALTPGISSGQGVPIGYETSELLATLFLLDIDLELKLSSRNILIRRFVDDMYVFVEGKENAKRFLVEYDLALQRRALVRNTNKSKYRLCNAEMADRSTLDREMRSKLSFVKNMQLAIDPNQAQQDIAAISEEDISCLGICDESDLDCIRENLSALSFLLYRQKTRSEKLRSISLCILEEFPDKTLHATEYLSQYKGNHQIKDRLLAIAERSTWYSPCRVDCIKTAIRVGEFKEPIQEIVIRWAIQNEDWYLKDAAIDILADNDYPLNQLANQIMEDDDCYLTQAKTLFRWFSQATNVDEQIQIINLAFESEHNTLKALGIYLSRREANISRDRLQSVHLPDELESLLFSTQDIEAFTTFATLFESVFGFEIFPTDVGIARRINDVTAANQSLLNLQDANSDPIDYVQALYGIVFQFLIAYIRISSKDAEFLPISMGDILESVHTDGEEYNSLSKLRDLKEAADNGNRSKVTQPQIKNIFSKVKTVIGSDLIAYYQSIEATIPEKLRRFATEHGFELTALNSDNELSQNQFQRLKEFLNNYFLLSTSESRKALFYRAFYDHQPVLGQIIWEGESATFTVNIIRILLRFNSKHAIHQLLDEIRKDVGEDQQQKIDHLLD